LNTVTLIEKKRDGHELTATEIDELIGGFTDGSVPDYQISAWLMATFINGLTDAETIALTGALVESGGRINLEGLTGVVDKHSTGGVGDKTTLIIAPCVAAAGLTVAKLSGRGLGHTGGTLDKLEAIPGMRTDLSVERLVKQASTIGIAVGGQTADIVPADKKLYALRDVTGTVAQAGLIAASVMSKKIAGGANGVVLDIKVGSGAFLKDVASARVLSDLMVSIGRSSRVHTVAMLSSMDDVLGNTVGNALEVEESVEVLKGGGPADLRELCVELIANMIGVGSGDPSSADTARETAVRVLDDGSGLAKFAQWVEAQDGDSTFLDRQQGLVSADSGNLSVSLKADASGYLDVTDVEAIGKASVALGAGRIRKEDLIDHSAGIRVHRKMGDPVEAGDEIATLIAGREDRLEQGLKLLSSAYSVTSEPARKHQLIIG